MTIEYFWLEAIWILALIFANGFFAASEIAVITMRKSRIDALLERGVKAAAVVARLKEDPDRFLATVQIGVTVISSLAPPRRNPMNPETTFSFRRPLGRSHRARHRRLADFLFIAGARGAGAQVPRT